jgi:hypothetical protein
MGNHANNRIANVSGGTALVNSATYTIEGSGNVGVGVTAITNDGLILANQAVGLTLQTGGAATTNNGVLRAQGGTLNLLNGTINNSNSAEIQSNGSPVVLDNVTINNGHFTTNSLGTLTIGASDTATFTNGATIDANVALGVANAGTLLLVGGSTYVNNGTITLNSTGTVTDVGLTGGGTVTLDGTGKLTMGSNANNRIANVSGGTALVNSASYTIEGSGNVGVGVTAITNDGLILANQAVGLTLQTGGTATTNNGILRAQGGTLTLLNGTINNSNSATIESNGSPVVLDNLTINNGHFTTNSLGTLTIGASDTATFTNGVTIDANVALGVANAGTLLLVGGSTYVNNGTITLNSTGTVTDVGLTGGGTVTLGGTGKLTMGTHANNRIANVSGGTALVNGATHTIEGSGNIGVGVTPITNNGTIRANQTVALTLQASAGALTNNGVFEALTGATLDIVGGFTNYNTVTDILTGGTYRVFGSGIMEFDGADIKTNAATILLDGAASTIRDQVGLDAFRNFATNAAAGNFTIQNGRNLNTPGAFANAGAVTIGAGSAFSANSGAADYNQSGGSTTVNGALNAANVNVNGGTLAGNGTVTGVVNNAGTVSPGSSPGILSITGNYAQTALGTLYIELGGTAPGAFDQLLISGNASLDGLLQVVLFGLFTPGLGDSFQIMTFASRGGDFSSYLLPTLGAGLDWQKVFGSNDLTLSVISTGAIPEPGTWLLVGAGLVLAGLSRRSRA